MLTVHAKLSLGFMEEIQSSGSHDALACFVDIVVSYPRFMMWSGQNPGRAAAV
jgi:hypothetical protein